MGPFKAYGVYFLGTFCMSGACYLPSVHIEECVIMEVSKMRNVEVKWLLNVAS